MLMLIPLMPATASAKETGFTRKQLLSLIDNTPDGFCGYSRNGYLAWMEEKSDAEPTGYSTTVLVITAIPSGAVIYSSDLARTDSGIDEEAINRTRRELRARNIIPRNIPLQPMPPDNAKTLRISCTVTGTHEMVFEPEQQKMEDSQGFVDIVVIKGGRTNRSRHPIHGYDRIRFLGYAISPNGKALMIRFSVPPIYYALTDFFGSGGYLVTPLR